MVQGILSTQQPDVLIQEHVDLSDGHHVIGDVQSLQFTLNAILVNFLHFATNLNIKNLINTNHLLESSKLPARC